MAKCKDCLHYCACMMMYEKIWGERPKMGDRDGQCDTFVERSQCVVREKSEWVYDHWCEFKCSRCGALSKTEPRGEENFCPNCGADMRKGENE